MIVFFNYAFDGIISSEESGHFNERVMKMTNLASPKHGAVIHLTKEELRHLTE